MPIVNVWASFLITIAIFCTVYEARPPSSRPPVIPSDSNITYISKDRNGTRILFQDNSSKDNYVRDIGEQDIIFPDTYQKIVFENLPRIDDSPQCAHGATFCEKYDSYPSQLVHEIIVKSRIRNDFFGKDEPPEDNKVLIANRNSDIEEFVCGSVQKTIFPKIGKNKNNKWKYIINQEQSDGYIQGIRIEVCRQEGVSCAIIGDIPSDYITSCKQKYIYRRLMSITDNGDPVPDSFQIPSACCCSYRKDLSFLTRFGSDIKK